MSDKDLIAEARRLENDYGDNYEVMTHMSALADALEAATERFEKAEHDRLYWRRRFQTMHKRAKRGEAERDAALEAIERVKAMHRPESNGRYTWCVGCSTDEYAEDWPCPTIQAIDGAPQPSESAARTNVQIVADALRSMPEAERDDDRDPAVVVAEYAVAALVAAQGAAPPVGRRPKRLLNQLNRIADALEEYEFDGVAADAPAWMRKAAEYIESERLWRAPVLPSSGVDEDKLARILCEKNYRSPDGEPMCAACRDKAHEVAEWLKGQGVGKD